MEILIVEKSTKLMVKCWLNKLSWFDANIITFNIKEYRIKEIANETSKFLCYAIKKYNYQNKLI